MIQLQIIFGCARPAGLPLLSVKSLLYAAFYELIGICKHSNTSRLGMKIIITRCAWKKQFKGI